VRSQDVHSKHPPDEEYRDDSPRDVNDPVANCFRLAKIEHAAMLAGARRDIAISLMDWIALQWWLSLKPPHARSLAPLVKTRGFGMTPG
jgi:hypothetical protein